MPLDTTNFHPQGPVKSVDLMQFYNLFTGLMTDQPISFSNSVTIGGNQGLTTVPLRVYGATGQNTNLIDLYPDRSSAQPGFGFSAVGRFGWGPGGASPQDTFLSRIATQNGHSSDTAGLLITPALEVIGNITATGNVSALGYLFTNGATLTGPAGTPNTLIVTQDLQVSRNLILMANGRILGSFSSPDPSVFQSSTPNGNTNIGLLPNGTATTSGIFLEGNSVIANDSYLTVQMLGATNAAIRSNARGTGALLPLYIGVGGHNNLALLNTGVVNTEQGLSVNAARAANMGLYLYGTDSSQDTNMFPGGGPGFYIRGPGFYFQNISGTVGAAINCGILNTGTISASGISCTIISVSDGANGVIQAGNGALYLRSASGSVIMDSAGIVLINNSAVRIGSGAIASQGGDLSISRNAIPANGLIYFGTGGQILQYIGATARFYLSQALDVVTEVISPTVGWVSGTHYMIKSGPNILCVASSGGFYIWSAPGGTYGTVYAAVFSVQSALANKQDVRPLSDPLSLVLDPSLHGISYTDRESGEQRIGFVADAWKPRVPEIVADDEHGDVLSMDYARVGAVTFEALKQYVLQTNARLDALEGKAA